MNIRKLVKHDIINGPSIRGILDSFLRAYDRHNRIYVEFTTDDGQTRFAYITGIEHEDSSGHSFNLAGFTEAGPIRDSSLSQHKRNITTPFALDGRQNPSSCYYNAKSRHGHIQFFITQEVANDSPEALRAIEQEERRQNGGIVLLEDWHIAHS